MLPTSRGIQELGRLSGDVASSETLPLEESDAKGWYIIVPKVGRKEDGGDANIIQDLVSRQPANEGGCT